MSGAAWSAVSAIAVALIVGTFKIVQFVLSRQSPSAEEAEESLSVSKAWSLVNGGLTAEVLRLGKELTALTELRGTDARRIGELETEVARLRTVEEMLHRAFRYIRALHTYAAGLLAWARAGALGDPPHPPEMPDGLVLPDDDT